MHPRLFQILDFRISILYSVFKACLQNTTKNAATQKKVVVNCPTCFCLFLPPEPLLIPLGSEGRGQPHELFPTSCLDLRNSKMNIYEFLSFILASNLSIFNCNQSWVFKAAWSSFWLALSAFWRWNFISAPLQTPPYICHCLILWAVTNWNQEPKATKGAHVKFQFVFWFCFGRHVWRWCLHVVSRWAKSARFFKAISDMYDGRR